MRSLSRILKSGQTVTGSHRVGVYQSQPADKPGGGYLEKEEKARDEIKTGYALISEEKRRILEHARHQAEQSAAEILEEAYAQRDKIVNTASEEAERIRRQAGQEGYEAGLWQSEEEIAAMLAELGGSIEEIRTQAVEGIQKIEDKTADMSLLIAEKILKKRVEEDSTEIAEMAREAVYSVRDQSNIVVHVSGRSLKLIELLEEKLEPLRENAGRSVRIKPEDQPPGYVRVETDEGITEASLFVQLANLKQKLAELDGQGRTAAGEA